MHSHFVSKYKKWGQANNTFLNIKISISHDKKEKGVKHLTENLLTNPKKLTFSNFFDNSKMKRKLIKKEINNGKYSTNCQSGK